MHLMHARLPRLQNEGFVRSSSWLDCPECEWSAQKATVKLHIDSIKSLPNAVHGIGSIEQHSSDKSPF